MGGSKKKKKRGGGGGRRADHHSAVAGNSEIVTEEVTALCAIFQEDCKVISESPPLIKIKLRPYSKDTGYEDSDVSAQLSVRCVQGYPYKCPKLQIEPEKGLSKTHADNLLSLLYDQANSNAREGRVMIYNLVEAAQEFLSAFTPQEQTHGSVVCLDNDTSCQIPEKGVTARSGESSSKGPFVFSHLDLFSGSGELWQWNLEMEESSRVSSKTFDSSNEHLKLPAVESYKPDQSLRLGTLEEESENETKSSDESVGNGTIKSTDESIGNGTIHRLKDVFVEGNLTENYTSSSESDSGSSWSESAVHFQSSETMKKDLLLVHLLRLVCSPKGALADALPEIMSELLNLGIVSEDMQDIAIETSSLFDRIFHRVFKKEIRSSKVSHFWKTTSDSGDQSSAQKSRYLDDFEELQTLGHGGFGHVVLCRNKLDDRRYAVKKIRLKHKIVSVNDRILREVATLSLLQHQHVVRYYQAWSEDGDIGNVGSTAWGSITGMSSSVSFKATDSSERFAHENKFESTLYIQMEYCPRTLRQMFESYNHLDKELAWHLFRQIVEGLAHIHGQGIIHRDLTPSNIFFDARNDIKIGDFGLAKFLKLEQLDQDDADAVETVGISNDGTGQIGTYFYTAPEIEKGWPIINEKADMYSLGIIFFELWHPFETLMERHILLSNLKLKGELPPSWVAKFPEQATLLRSLMSPKASDRPSATELLKHAFPPRMEHEMLDNILRMIPTSEGTSIRQKITHALFDEDKLSTKGSQENVGRLKSVQDDISSFIFTDEDTTNRDRVVDIATEIFRQHGAKHLETLSMRILGYDQQVKRGTVRLLSHGGDMIEFCHELRYPFAKWIIAKQKSFFRRYETSYVYRRAIGHSPPNRYLQGDFDIVGGATALTEAEIIKATMDILSRYFSSGSCDIHLNHWEILEAIWNWTGVKPENRQKVAELLSLLGSLRPQSSERKSKWGVIRRQLRQELDLSDDVVNRLQTVGLRFCGTADKALPRLRGALPADKSIRKALDEVSELFNFLSVWKIERHVFLDVLMPPIEYYHRNLYFQIYLKRDHNPVSVLEGTLLAVGGRYDYLLQQMVDSEYKSSPPGAVGASIALETVLLRSSSDDHKFHRNDMGINILVCSRGGGGLLFERMELVAELWEENFKAEFVPLQDPSLTEQYEYANEHDIKCLVVITESGVSQNGSVKVRHLELKKEKEVDRENLVKFLSEAMATQFRNPSIWS